MKRLELERFGPIKKAELELGDLTVFVGHQASGKSLLIQLIKAISDAGSIRSELKRYGYDWARGDAVASYSALYFGGGLGELLGSTKSLLADGRKVSLERLAKPGGGASQDETVFVVPAQRVLVLQDGLPKPFMAYLSGDPYCMRRFSEHLRSQMDRFASGKAIFPQTNQLMSSLRTVINKAVYAGFELKLKSEGSRRSLTLSRPGDDSALPFTAWSAGQREFTPLLFSLYWLLPPAKMARRGALNHVIIEEPEMGLHPQAIVGFMLCVLALLHRGYRVTLSTHSPVVLDVLWALQSLRDVRAKKARQATSAVRKIFEISSGDNSINGVLHKAFEKELRVYYFEREGSSTAVHDISTLDPASVDERTNGWGGLSGFSGRIADIVGDAREKAGCA